MIFFAPAHVFLSDAFFKYIYKTAPEKHNLKGCEGKVLQRVKCDRSRCHFAPQVAPFRDGEQTRSVV